MGVQDQQVFPVAEAQDLEPTVVLSVKMRAEVYPADLGSESQELTAGHLDGFLFGSEKKTAPGVALVAFEIIGFVE